MQNQNHGLGHSTPPLKLNTKRPREILIEYALKNNKDPASLIELLESHYGHWTIAKKKEDPDKYMGKIYKEGDRFQVKKLYELFNAHGWAPSRLDENGRLRFSTRTIRHGESSEEKADQIEEEKNYENTTMDERAVRVAAFRLASRGLISPESAYRIQKEISDRITAEGRGGLCRGPDIHLAMGAGSKEMSEDMAELDRRAQHYEKEILKTA